MNKFKNNSPIFEAAYETASDLHSIGLMTDARMNEFKESCLESSPVDLDADVFDYFNKKCDFNAEKLRVVINDLLRKDIEITEIVS